MTKKLIINEDDALLCGVCSGIADYLSTSHTSIRCLFLISAFLLHGIIFLYIILWLLLPYKDDFYE